MCAVEILHTNVADACKCGFRWYYLSHAGNKVVKQKVSADDHGTSNQLILKTANIDWRKPELWMPKLTKPELQKLSWMTHLTEPWKYKPTLVKTELWKLKLNDRSRLRNAALKIDPSQESSSWTKKAWQTRWSDTKSSGHYPCQWAPAVCQGFLLFTFGTVGLRWALNFRKWAGQL